MAKFLWVHQNILAFNKVYFFLIGFSFFFISPAISQKKIHEITFDTSITFQAGDYKISGLKEKFFGSNYRDVWTAPVSAPVFNLHKSEMKVVRLGGGRESITLRLQDSSGHEYVLRSLDKKTSKALPDVFDRTFVTDVLQDQATAENPYAAFIVSPMLSALGLYHTIPLLVYVPNDKAFGEFQNLANKPALFEMRANGDLSDFENFGNAPNAVGTEKMLESLKKDIENRMDEKMYLRCRLFDMVIGDWGRHEDQWRWAEFPNTNGGKTYRPIPRDRDHAFFKVNGLFPSIFVGRFGLKNMSDFTDHFNYQVGVNFGAATLDRELLTSLTKEEWLYEANYIKTHLTDSVIQASVCQLPINVYKACGRDLIRKIKSRRDALSGAAEKFYTKLAKDVNIIGSEKRELFEVNRVNSGNTQVSVYHLSDNGEKGDLKYQRIFFINDTRQINIYGLQGDDEFKVEGKVNRGIQVQLIGGEGNDVFIDNSAVIRGRKKTLIIDTKEKENNVVHREHEARDLRSDNPKDSVNVVFTKYQHNYIGPYLYLGYNPDDFVFFGLGITRRTYEFRKHPFKNLQRFGINYATRTGAYNIRYIADFRLIYRRWHLFIDSRYFGPQFVLNYFGFGNESQNVEGIEFYRTRGSKIYINPSLYKQFTSRIIIGIGPEYSRVKIEDQPGHFVTSPGAVESNQIFKGTDFIGLKAYLRFSNVDSVLTPITGYYQYTRGFNYFPTNGYRFLVATVPTVQLNGDKRFISTHADLSLFKTFPFMKYITFAFRVGGAWNFGDYFFFQAPNLGGTDNLRGFRRTRFFGDKSFYSNNEIRLKLFKFRNYLFTSNIGFIGFYDVGRVWAKNETSHQWHSGYGPGLWIEFFESFLISGTVGFSEDGTNLNIQYALFF